MDNQEKESKQSKIEILMKQYEELYGYDHIMKNYNYFYDKAVSEQYMIIDNTKA